jgi:nucleotide-binding universal stress UspA family protein
MIKKILVAYDGSKSAERAFSFGLEQAEVFKATVLVLSVAQPPEPPTMVETTALLESATEHFQESFKHLQEEAKQRNIPLETKIVVGHAADQIVHHADQEECDLIVMGHRGKSMLQRWLLGSVSKRVLSYAPCSVTIVR